MVVPRIPLKPPPPVLVPDILLTQEALDSPDFWAVTACIVDFVNDLREERRYVDDEVPRAALHIYYVDLWLAEVNNGGFSQYIANHTLYAPHRKALIDITREGLEAMGAEPFLALFDEMAEIVQTGIRPDGAPSEDNSMERIEAAFERLSDRFFKLNNSRYGDKPRPGSNVLSGFQRAYALAQPNLKVLPKQEWRLALVKLGKSNPLRTERAAEAKRARDAAEAQYPMYQAAKELCRLAGRAFDRFTAGGLNTLDGVEVNGMGMLTDQGSCIMLMPGNEALLFVMKMMPPAALAAHEDGTWLTYIEKHPTALDGLNDYRMDDGVLARLAWPEPLWPLHR
jgi:hypothetical protein